MATAGTVLKRILVGRQVSSSKLEHTLLPKVLALPVFSSDALSSVAYASEEILLVLVGVSLASRGLVLPISLAVATLMVIVVASYRQTVRAYPSGGGAYIVSKENLGTLPGLVAAAALLTDYVLTVSVSVAAGVFAITSAAPGLTNVRVPLSIGFVVFISLMNLRGVRESGALFAVPTYAFVVSTYAMIALGLGQCLQACPVATPPADAEAGTAAGVGLFLILRAFSSGSTALTGVEAISNGVPAFRRPQAKNAATTLGMMGVIAIGMFMGISFLAVHTGALPSASQTKSVVAQIAEAVFHGGFGFFAVQVTTAAILVLAANTAFQDFPRLSAILARDGFIPRQFQNRGDRLVFSNGILVLATLASLLLWAFDANVTRLIQLYVVGVFTSFTLSQSGMVRHWLRERGEGWRRSIAINAVGAVATGIVLVVIAASKFVHGAWMVIAAIPVIVGFFWLIHRHYETVGRLLRHRRVRYGDAGVNRCVLVVTEVDAAVAEALGYVRSLRPASFVPLYVGFDPPEDAAARWAELSGGEPRLQRAPRPGVRGVLAYVRTMDRDPDDFVTVVIPELFGGRSLLRAVFKPVTFALKVRLLTEPGVVVTDVPVLAERGHLVGVDGLPLIPERVEVLVFVGSANDPAVRALNYARTLNAHEIRAVFLAADPERIPGLLRAWDERGLGVRLDIVEAPFRDLGPPLLDEVRRATSDPGTVAAVVIPEVLVPRWWHRILHNNRALFIKRMLLFEQRVILTAVPYRLAVDDEAGALPGTGGGDG